MKPIDYLLIGHITRDLTPEGDQPGGTVTYSGRVAAALGSHTAVLTSHTLDFTGIDVLDSLTVHSVPSATTTTFENVYTPHGRVQTIHATATTLTPAHLPTAWHEPAIVHLAPVVHEVDTRFIQHFPHSLICLTPQGWLREWGADGRVHP
ncbi:MAG: ribokinase, partial [Anaerolineae bacterium]|nr:ribokinase [Anaerolineae bacterium]